MTAIIPTETMRRGLAVMLALVTLVPVCGAELKLAPFCGDHMVVQRDRPIVLSGSAGPGERVTAEFAGGRADAVADAKGVFTLKLPAQKACKEGRVLTVKGGSNTIELKDVLVGDVWLCTGQSNMEISMNDLQVSAEAKRENRPLIRRMKISHAFLPFPADPMKVAVDGGGWQEGTPETIARWAATAYYFARAIQNRYPDLPIGLCECCHSGSPVQSWIPMEAWAAFPSLKEGEEVANRRERLAKFVARQLEETQAWAQAATEGIKHEIGFANPPHSAFGDGSMPSGMYNAMMKCLTGTPVAGAIWYQGEANTGQPDYAVKMQAMVTGWRKAWGFELPFYYVQLPGLGPPSEDPGARAEWAITRDLQRRALALIPKSGMASAIDVGEANDLHPKNKLDPGERLARWALRDVYGDKEIVVSGPLYKAMKVEGAKVRIAFEHAESGLMVGHKDGRAPVVEVKDGKLGGFAIRGRDGKWVWADAVIDGKIVAVSSAAVAEPVAVRYAFSSNPVSANLYNKAGLPASTFTTEE